MKTFILLIATLLVWNTTQASDSTGTIKPQRVWSNYHGPRKVEYFLKGDIITYRQGYMLVTRPRHLNKQIAYVEQGFYKHCSRHKIRRIFRRNCGSVITES